MANCKGAVLTIVLIAGITICQAQQVSILKSGNGNRRTAQDTPITNQETGQRLTMEQYGQLVKEDPYAYHLVPDYTENGQSSTYTMRKATAEEHETHRFRDRDPAKQPKAGQVIAPFVMTGLTGKTYRSADLPGKVVVLCFLVSLDKTIWTPQQSEELTGILQPYLQKTDFISLGVLNSEQTPAMTGLSKTEVLPFMPIPNAYGFHNKYHITTIPTFIVLDKTGKVAANIQGAGSFMKLKQILETVTK